MRKFLLISSILLLIVFVGLASFPAALVWRWFAPPTSALQLNEISGPWWRGFSARTSIDQVEIGALRWALAPISLLKFSPELKVSLEGKQANGDAEMQFIDGTRRHLKQLNAQFDAAYLGPVLKLPLTTPKGTIALIAQDLVLEARGMPERGEVNFEWRDASMRGLINAEIGTIRFQAKGANHNWLGEVSSRPEDPLTVRGGFSAQDQQFNLEMTLYPKDPNSLVAKAIEKIGQPTGDGGRILKISGQLKPPSKP
jgi:hypothetical protein